VNEFEKALNSRRELEKVLKSIEDDPVSIEAANELSAAVHELPLNVIPMLFYHYGMMCQCAKYTRHEEESNDDVKGGMLVFDSDGNMLDHKVGLPKEVVDLLKRIRNDG